MDDGLRDAKRAAVLPLSDGRRLSGIARLDSEWGESVGPPDVFGNLDAALLEQRSRRLYSWT
jgi:hypothetical protein